MKIIGLTGGIGSGKTTVAKLFEELGVPVYNSDLKAKKLMQNSKELRTAVMDLLGEESYKLQRLNKKYIADKIFEDKELLQKLNAIVHPAVRQDFFKWVKKKRTPYETFDKIILVKAPKEVRLQRVLTRDAISEKEILARMENQWDDSKKIPLADYVIENTDLGKTKLQVEKIHHELTKMVA